MGNSKAAVAEFENAFNQLEDGEKVRFSPYLGIFARAAVRLAEIQGMSFDRAYEVVALAESADPSPVLVNKDEISGLRRRLEKLRL